LLVLIAILLAFIPAVVVLYPLVRRMGADEFLVDESSVSAELTRRWESALAGLKAAELELSIGNLSEDDYDWLKGQYTTEAALVMKAMDLEEQQEQDLLDRMTAEVTAARERALGPSPRNDDGNE
jgi:hypothetical protein